MLILSQITEWKKKKTVQIEFLSAGTKLILVENGGFPISKGYTVVDLTNSR